MQATPTDIPAPGAVSVPGRFLDRAKGVEAPCLVVWTGDARFTIRSTQSPDSLGEVVVYADGVGRISGIATGRDSGSFDIVAQGSGPTLGKLANRLEWIRANGTGAGEQRQDARFVPDEVRTAIRIRGQADEATPARIVDVSRSGVSVAAALRPPVGSRLFIGRRGADVVRLTEEGFAARFVVPIPAPDLGAGLRL